MTQRKLRVLIAYSMWSNFTPTILEYLLALKQFSPFDVSYVHVTNGVVLDFDLNSFDIVFNNYCARFVMDGLVSDSYRRALKGFRGLKVIAVQDEYDQTNKFRAALREHGFHVLLTCVPPEFWSRVYPRSELPDLQLIHVLTGYMPELAVVSNASVAPLKDRPTLIGYRGGYVGARFGRLAFDKTEIGRRMREVCEVRGIRHDIATDAQSRIYGRAWYDFIGSCRAVLGSESGSNVFDFDGSIDRKYREMEIELGRPVSYEEFRIYTEPIEKEFDIGQISPRIFEYAVMRTPMILFRGRYSGIIEPEAHYIPLEKDFSNVDQVLERLNDLPALEVMADHAYEHLVASGRFGYRCFAQMLAGEFVKRYDSLAASRPTGGEAPAIEPEATQAPTSDAFIDKLRDEVLRERPTPLPHFLPDFQHKQRLLILLEELRNQTLQVRIKRFMGSPVAAAMRHGRRCWAYNVAASVVPSTKAFINRIPVVRTFAGFVARRISRLASVNRPV